MPAPETLVVIGEILVNEMKIDLAIAPGNHCADAAERIFLLIILKNSLELLAPLINELQWADHKISSVSYAVLCPMSKNESPLRVLGNCADTSVP